MRDTYAQKGLEQIPRLLSLQDRNPYSPTYGCFKRTYWLDKTVDFPDALPQYGVLSMALAYGNDMPGNIYKNQPKMREWILAGMKYWTKIQHRDGSFDEFYPNEHGWTGPTGFLLYAMCKSYMILNDRGEFPAEFRDAFFSACSKAADFIIKYDEHGVLANHHAMGVLPVYYTYHVLQEQKFLDGYEEKLAEFLSFHTREGWSLEYDGADIGYLSATVSFLGKAWKLNNDERLEKVMRESTEFLSHFVYPNGFFAGSMGSRNTLHFYSHGIELLAPTMPLAGRAADVMLEALGEGKVVPAALQADRYFLYRIPEHLESYLDYGERSAGGILPYEREDFCTVFPEGRFYIQKTGDTYVVGNAAKGGVLKVFDVPSKKLLLNDGGIIGKTADGNILTSQWIHADYEFLPDENGFSVSGSLHSVPSVKLFTPMKLIVFRIFLMVFGWHTGMAYRIKGLIRKLLMLKSKAASAAFKRVVAITDDSVCITDTITRLSSMQFASLQVSDEFFVRYVPQSRYFQSQEFDARGHTLNEEQLSALNNTGSITIERVLDLRRKEESEMRIL